MAELAKAVEGRWTLRDQVTPAIQRMNQNTLLYKRTLRDLQAQGKKTWNDLRGMSSFVGIGLVAAIGAAVNAGADFQDQMAQASTLLTGDVNGKIQTFSSQVLQLAKDTGTSTSLITDGLYQTISSIGDTADAMKILDIATKSATASNANVSDGVNLLSLVMKGYGNVSAQTAKQVADMAFMTANLGVTTFPEMAASMGKAIPLASTLGVSMKDLFAAEATLTGVTGNTSEVTTGLSAVFQALLAPTGEMQKVYHKLGISSGQALIQSKGFKGALDLLVGSTHGNTAELSKMFGQVEGLNQVLALTGTQSTAFDEKQKAMANSAGAMEQAYSRATDTVKHKWKVLLQTVTASVIRGGQNGGLMKDVGVILDMLTGAFNFVVNHWSQMSPIIYGVVAALVAYKLAAISATAWTSLLGKESTFAAIKTAFMGSTSLVAAGEMGVMAAAQNVLNAAMRANPIGVVVTILGLLVVGIIYAKNHIQELYLTWMKVWNGIVGITQWAVNKYIDYVNFTLRLYRYLWDSIKFGGMSIWNVVITAAQAGINGLIDLFNSGIEKLVGGINSLVDKMPAKLRDMLGLDGGISFTGIQKVDFSSAKAVAVKPVWDTSIGFGHVDFGGAKFSQDHIMAQTKKAQEERDKNNAAQIKALTDNTKALQENSDKTDKNTKSTDDNSNSNKGLGDQLKRGVTVNMTAEQIADGLVPRLERHLYGTT